MHGPNEREAAARCGGRRTLVYSGRSSSVRSGGRCGYERVRVNGCYAAASSRDEMASARPEGEGEGRRVLDFIAGRRCAAPARRLADDLAGTHIVELAGSSRWVGVGDRRRRRHQLRSRTAAAGTCSSGFAFGEVIAMQS
jgi:hypothetical protein